MKNFIKNQKGFTLVELVVVIAIIGILAGIAVPRFLDATASARGAKIVADMRTIQSAEMIFYAKNAKYPTQQSDFADLVQGGWPLPPNGKFIVAKVLDSNGGTTEGVISDTGKYSYDENKTGNNSDGTGGTVVLDGATVGGQSGKLTLTQLLGSKN